jgi:hypothetical protein
LAFCSGRWISSHGKPPLTAWSIVGDGSNGSPSAHIRSFQLSTEFSADLLAQFERTQQVFESDLVDLLGKK